MSDTDRTVFQGAPDFVGLSNFVKVALSPDFQKALRQTLGLTAVSFLLEAIIALAVALALDRGLKGASVSEPLSRSP